MCFPKGFSNLRLSLNNHHTFISHCPGSADMVTFFNGRIQARVFPYKCRFYVDDSPLGTVIWHCVEQLPGQLCNLLDTSLATVIS
jgi:hypothetical protein